MLLLGYLLLALVVAAVLFYLVVAFLPSGLTVQPMRDDRPLELPANRRMRLADLDRVRIPVSVRGYRFAETDELIDRLAAEIVVRDEEIARLKQQGYPVDADAPQPLGAAAEPEWAVRELGEPAAAAVAEFEDERARDRGERTRDRDERERDRDEPGRDRGELAGDEEVRPQPARAQGEDAER